MGGNAYRSVQGKSHCRHPIVHVIGIKKTGFIVWRMSPLMLTTGICWLILVTPYHRLMLVLNLLTLMKWVTCATITIVMFIITVWSCSTVECVLPQRWNQVEESEWDLITCHTITQVLFSLCAYSYTCLCSVEQRAAIWLRTHHWWRNKELK